MDRVHFEVLQMKVKKPQDHKGRKKKKVDLMLSHKLTKHSLIRWGGADWGSNKGLLFRIHQQRKYHVLALSTR